MSWIRKEWLELTRQYKILIMFFSFTFFAILDPLMIKLLPHILGSELEAQGIDLSLLFSAEASAGVQGFMGNVFQIIPIILAFALSGYFSNELNRQTLLIPLTKGINLTKVFLSKYVVLTVSLVVVHLLAGSINFLYSNMIFSDARLTLDIFLLNHFYSALVLIHFVSIFLLIDVWVQKNFVSSLMTLGYFFALSASIGLLRSAARFSPFYLVKEASSLAQSFSPEAFSATLSALIISGIAIWFSLVKIKKMKLTP